MVGGGEEHLCAGSAGKFLVRSVVPLLLLPFLVIMQGYTRLLKVLGSNLAEFLQNLNDLHLHLQYCWPDMLAPAFRCEQVGVVRGTSGVLVG